MNKIKLAMAIGRELLFSKNRKDRDTTLIKSFSADQMVQATTEGGRIDGRVASGYLYQTVNISQILAGCNRVLDIGCGACVQLIQVAEVNPEIEFIGIDCSKHIVDMANELISQKGVSNVKVIQGDMTDLKEIESGTFDGVISTMSLHHLNDVDSLRRCFSEMRRVLKDDGSLFIEDFAFFKLQQTIDFFVKEDAMESGKDLFNKLYMASMIAAFPINEVDEINDQYFRGVSKLYITSPIPFLFSIMSKKNELGPVKINKLRKLYNRLSPKNKKLFLELTNAFKAGGLQIPKEILKNNFSS